MTLLASLASLEATLKIDLIQAIGKPVLASALNVEANPTVPNLMGQKIVIAAALIGAVPTLESEGISAIAAWVVSEIQPVLAQKTA